MRVRDVISGEFQTIGEKEFLSRAVGMFREGVVKPGAPLVEGGADAGGCSRSA